MSMQQKKKKNIKLAFKNVLSKIVSNQNWKSRWNKLKSFVTSKQNMKNSADSRLSERNAVFQLILALYAGEDTKLVFTQLEILAEKYP